MSKKQNHNELFSIPTINQCPLTVHAPESLQNLFAFGLFTFYYLHYYYYLYYYYCLPLLSIVLIHCCTNLGTLVDSLSHKNWRWLLKMDSGKE